MIHLITFFSEKEKTRRWEEIRLRQHRILAEAEHTTPAHLDHIMRSGFTMNDIKGLNRNYPEDAVESDDFMRPARPTRKGSVSQQNGNYSSPTLEINGHNMQRSTSNLDMNDYNEDDKTDDKKKRGRSPFRLFGKKRDQSKDKIKGKEDDKRLNQGRNVIQSNVMTRNPTVRVSNVRHFNAISNPKTKLFNSRLT